MKRRMILGVQVLLLQFMGCTLPRQVSYLTLGDGECRPAWRDVRYDETVEQCCANLIDSDMSRHTLRSIAESYPNLSALSVQCWGQQPDSRLDMDCRDLSLATNLVCVEICNLNGIMRNIEELCRDPKKKDITLAFAPGEGIYHHANICRPFDDSPVDKADCIIDLGDHCTLEVEVFGGIYCFEDNVHRNARFTNKGDEAISVRKFPESCNTVELFGAFDLSTVDVCASVDMLVWNYDGEDFQKYISEITPARFPNLRFLSLRAFAEHERSIDVGGLSRLDGLKAIHLQFSNIIPVGIDDLYGIKGLWGIEGLISFYRNE